MEEIETISTSVEGDITDIKSDFFGKKLAVSTTFGKLYIFENIENQYQKISEIAGHIGTISQISWSLPQFGPLLATCGFDKKICVYNIINQKIEKIYEFNEAENSFNTISFNKSNNNLLLCAGDLVGNIYILQYIKDNFYNQKLENAHDFGVNSIKFLDDKQIISCGNDKTIKIWKADDNFKYENTVALSEIDAVLNDIAIKDENHFICVGDDGCCHYFIFNDNKWASKIVFESEAKLEKVAVSEEGNAFCVLDENGVEKLLYFDEINS